MFTFINPLICRRLSSSKLSVNDSISDEFSDTSLSGSRRQLNDGTDSVTGSYYQSYDDIGYEEPSMNAYGEKIPTPTRDKCIRSSSSYSGDVWRDIGLGGGVVQLIGSDVSLHISSRSPTRAPTACQTCSTAAYAKPNRPRKHSAGV